MNDDRPADRAGAAEEPAFTLDATALAASLTVADLDASVAWYRDVLGFVAEHVFERNGVAFAVRMSAGSVLLLLTQDNGAKGAERVKGEGMSLQLTTSHPIDELAARIKARGWTLDLEPTDMAGARVFRLRDPDGFRFAVSSPRQGSATRR